MLFLILGPFPNKLDLTCLAKVWHALNIDLHRGEGFPDSLMIEEVYGDIYFCQLYLKTIRALLAPHYDTIFTQGQKVKYTNPKIQITTRATRKRPIVRFSSSLIIYYTLILLVDKFSNNDKI